MVAEGNNARKRVRRTKKTSRRDPGSSAIEDKHEVNRRPHKGSTAEVSRKKSKPKIRDHTAVGANAHEGAHNESSDFFADDESTNEHIEPQKQPFMALPLQQGNPNPPRRWPYVPMLRPEHYDAWMVQSIPDPQETIHSIFRDFIFPSANLAYLRNFNVRTERGLVDLDVIAPCVPGQPCILDRMCYKDGVCHTCYDQQRLRDFRAYF